MLLERSLEGKASGSFQRVMTRQIRFVHKAIKVARERGFDFLLHLDDDELLYPEGRSIPEVFQSHLRSSKRCVHFENLEAVFQFQLDDARPFSRPSTKFRPAAEDEDFAKTDETPSEAGEVYGCDGGTGSSVGVLNTSQEVVELLYNRTVNFRFDDPFLPYVLREVIHDPEHHRLLRLCEAGIPAWAIVLPKFTGLYHRYMRHLVAAIVVLVSCLSMLLGFYDLYKRIPLVRSLLKQSLGPLSSKLEELVVVRLSFLLGWILPYNTILRRTWHGLQMLWDFLKSICLGLFSAATMATSAASSLLQPATSFFFSPVIGAASAGRSVFQAVATTGNAFARLFSGSGSSFSSGFGTAGLLRAEFNMARQAFMSVYNSTCFLGATIAKHQASTSVWLSRWRHRQWRRVAKLTERPLWLLVLLILAFTRFYPGDFTVRCGDAILWDLAVAVTRFF
eukprot:g32909.t1